MWTRPSSAHRAVPTPHPTSEALVTVPSALRPLVTSTRAMQDGAGRSGLERGGYQGETGRGRAGRGGRLVHRFYEKSPLC